MTKDQVNLLFDLKASKERGSASMSCNQRDAVAGELVKLKLAESNGDIFGLSFYRITEKGLKTLKGIHCK